MWTGPWSSRGRGPLRSGRPADQPFGRQPVEQRGRLDSNETRNRDATLGDNDLVAFSRPLQPVAEVGTEFAYSYVHTPTVQDKTHRTYVTLLASACGFLLKVSQWH